MQANDNYILLLHQRFAGTITPAGSEALQAWLDQSPENKRLAAELREVWEKSEGYGKTFSPDLDRAFGQLRSRIDREERPRARLVLPGSQLLRWAAALVLLLSAVWAYREMAAPVQMIQASALDQEKRALVLPDGSKVWLRRGSALEYPATFSDAKRDVALSGEAYFEVAHNPDQPFRVDLPDGGRVEVLGTQFGVRTSDDRLSTDVYVRSGKVRFTPDTEGAGYAEGAVLTARQKVSYNRHTREMRVDQSASLNELAWQSGGLEFVKTPLSDVVADLESYYNVKITLQNAGMRQCAYTSPLTNQPIDKVLASLALTYQFRVTTPAPGAYVLSGGTCQ